MIEVPSFLVTESPGDFSGSRLTPAAAAPLFLSFPGENPRSFAGLQGDTPAPASFFPGGCLHLLCTWLSETASQNARSLGSTLLFSLL